MDGENLIFTISGIRGIFGKDLTYNIVKKIAIAYGLWLKNGNKTVIIGRDTRPSSKDIEKAIIEGLILVDCKVVNLGICPTPIVIYTKDKLNIPGGVIISGSHNPQEWNGIKILSTKTFLNHSEVEEILHSLEKIKIKDYNTIKLNQSKIALKSNAVDEYIQGLYNVLNFKKIRNNNKLSVIVDTGAGAGKIATPRILKELGCQVKIINNELDENNNFPREIEPIEKNLENLIKTVLKGKYDIGFAHDCDADRLAIIGDDGTCYREDVGLALITDFYLNRSHQNGKKAIFVTNLASSLIFEALAEKYDARIVRTPVGEYHLAKTMNTLIKHEKPVSIIFGGEGSCGGVMLPQFNNTRDGIFAAGKIIEILVETNEKISKLVSKLPKFYSFRENINITGKNLNFIIEQFKNELQSKGENVSQIDMDLKFGYRNDWFVLIHPSNTEPIIRIISEGKTESLAKKNLKKTVKIAHSIISRV